MLQFLDTTTKQYMANYSEKSFEIIAMAVMSFLNNACSGGGGVHDKTKSCQEKEDQEKHGEASDVKTKEEEENGWLNHSREDATNAAKWDMDGENARGEEAREEHEKAKEKD